MQVMQVYRFLIEKKNDYRCEGGGKNKTIYKLDSQDSLYVIGTKNTSSYKASKSEWKGFKPLGE